MFNGVPLTDIKDAEEKTIGQILRAHGGIFRTELTPPSQSGLCRNFTAGMDEAHIDARNAYKVQGIVPAISIYKVEDACLTESNLLVKDRRIVYAPDLVPSFYLHNADSINSDIEGASSKAMRVEDDGFVFLLPNFREYGHFIVEMFPRLLVIKDLLSLGWNLPVFIPLDSPVFIEQALALVLPNAEVKRYDRTKEALFLKRAYIPSTCSVDHIFHPALSYLLFQFSMLVNPVASDTFSSFIYLSRTSFRRERLNDFRILENEQELSTIAIKYGAEIIYPERLSLKAQVSVFSKANIIVAEAGSALHNTLFSGPGAQVLSLNYINSVQHFIAGLRGHYLKFILPIDGIERTGKTTFVDKTVPREYVIDSIVFENELRRMIARRSGLSI